MTVHNGESYLKQAIDSIIKQSFSNWELIIVNNKSSDDTLTILNKYSSNQQITIINLSKMLRRTEALNFAINHTNRNSCYLMNMDADDILADEWLNNAIKYLDENKIADCLAGAAYIINEKREIKAIFKASIKSNKNINEFFSYTFPIVHSSTVFKRKLIEDLRGPYNEKISIGQDWDLFLDFSQKAKIFFIDKYSVYWRRYSESITGKTSNQISSRLDKIRNLEKGAAFAVSIKNKIKNRYRRGIENFVLSLLYLKKGDLAGFVYRLTISLALNPLSFLTNNKIMGLLGINKEFYYHNENKS